LVCSGNRAGKDSISRGGDGAGNFVRDKDGDRKFDRARGGAGNVDSDVFYKVGGVLRGKSLDGDKFISSTGQILTFLSSVGELVVAGNTPGLMSLAGEILAGGTSSVGR